MTNILQKICADRKLTIEQEKKLLPLAEISKLAQNLKNTSSK